MGGLSIWHWMLFAAVALLLFGGKGKISDIMGDVAKGIKSFKKGMAEDDDAAKPAAAGAAPGEPRRRSGRRQRDGQGRLTLPVRRAARRRRDRAHAALRPLHVRLRLR